MWETKRYTHKYIRKRYNCVYLTQPFREKNFWTELYEAFPEFKVILGTDK
jgi:hypothetical protein